MSVLGRYDGPRVRINWVRSRIADCLVRARPRLMALAITSFRQSEISSYNRITGSPCLDRERSPL